MRKSMGIMVASAALLLMLAACQPVQDTRSSVSAAREATFYVGPELVDCVGVAPMKCMLVREN
ncbi:MAG: hypothetical protein ACK47M_12410, partial [Caldilinea sp.]